MPGFFKKVRGLLGIANCFKFKGVYPFNAQMKSKTSFEALPEIFA